MNILSLFDGMSCGQIALERAGIKVENYYASEIEDNAIKVTQYNYPNTIQLGDVTKIHYKNGILYYDGGEIKTDIDMIIGGSPCQNLSIACITEHRKGLEGEKSSLFYEYYRILNEVNPKYFLLENVGSMNKKDKEIITELLGVEPIQINSKLVSAQLRNRYYWTNIPNIKQLKDKKIKLQDVLTEGYTDREKARCLMEGDSRPHTTPVKMFHRYYSTGFTTLIFKNQQHYVDCKEHYDTYFKGKSAKEIDELIKNNNIDLSVYNGLRYLNQEELEQLQTVPKGYTKILTRNQAASVLGNGWTVDVIAHIFKELV